METPDCQRNVLSVRGLVIDNVASIDTLGKLEDFGTPAQVLIESWKSTTTKCDTQDFFVDTSRYTTLDEALLDILSLEVGIKVACTESESFLKEMLEQLTFWINGWRFFISPKGYLGLANGRAQPTDFICILLGARVPYILRRQGSFYTVVREAFVHGLMHSSAMSLVGRGCEIEALQII
jgi:hypothetical protein